MASNYYNGNGHLPKTSADALVIFFCTLMPHMSKKWLKIAHTLVCAHRPIFISATPGRRYLRTLCAGGCPLWCWLCRLQRRTLATLGTRLFACFALTAFPTRNEHSFFVRLSVCGALCLFCRLDVDVHMRVRLQDIAFVPIMNVIGIGVNLCARFVYQIVIVEL